MKPPVLQTRWYNQPSFDPQGRGELVESFSVRLVDPRGSRTLWIQLAATGGRHERFGEASAIYVDLAVDKPLKAHNRFGAERVAVDPERAGLGVGESVIEENATAGLVRGEGFAISWALTMTPELPPYLPLPSERLYRGRWLNTKWVSPLPCARVNGRIEIWTHLTKEGEHTRDSVQEVIEVRDWLGMQRHCWGDALPTRYAWTHCNQFEGAAPPCFFEAVSAEMKVARLFQTSVTTARLVLGTEVFRFDTWRTIRSAHSSYGPTQWKFELGGPDGALVGTVTARHGHTVTTARTSPSGAQTSATITPLADLTLELTPTGGQRRVLKSTNAALEVGQPGTQHGASRTP